jgi:hypothetical protein
MPKQKVSDSVQVIAKRQWESRAASELLAWRQISFPGVPAFSAPARHAVALARRPVAFVAAQRGRLRADCGLLV